jgi:hypothetical protein
MKNRYNSVSMPSFQASNNQTQFKNSLSMANNYQMRTNANKQKYQSRTPPIIEIYDLEALELDVSNNSSSSSSSSSLSSSSSSAELNLLNKNAFSQYSPNSSTSSSPRSSFETSSLYQSDSNYSDEPFTFQGIKKH